VALYWPSFGSCGKGKLTIAQLLQHEAGLAHALPRKLAKQGAGAAIRTLCSFKDMTRWIATAKPLPDEIGRESYHAVTQGWLLGGLAEQVACQHVQNSRWRYPQLVEDLVLRPLGIQDKVFVCVPSDGSGCANGIRDDVGPRLTSISMHPKELAEDGDLLGDFGASNKSNGNGLQSLGLDPRAFNDPTVRKALLPAVNTHFTARGLATIYAALAMDGSLGNGQRVLSDNGTRALHALVASGGGRTPAATWPGGFRRMQAPKGQLLFGFPGLFNNMAYSDPAEGLGVAVLVNQLDYEGEATKELLLTAATTMNIAPHSMDGLGVNGKTL